MAYLTPDRCMMWLKKSPVIYSAVLRDVDQDRATSARDGADGWNVLEIMCHINDLEQVYTDRINMTLNGDRPTFPMFDHLGAVTQHDYAHQLLSDVVASFVVRRTEKLRMLASLSVDQWERVGVHPEFGEMNLLSQTSNTALHDLNHTEQIVRVLGIASMVV